MYVYRATSCPTHELNYPVRIKLDSNILHEHDEMGCKRGSTRYNSPHGIKSNLQVSELELEKKMADETRYLTSNSYIMVVQYWPD